MKDSQDRRSRTPEAPAQLNPTEGLSALTSHDAEQRLSQRPPPRHSGVVPVRTRPHAAPPSNTKWVAYAALVLAIVFAVLAALALMQR